MIADEAQSPLAMEAARVEGDDAGRLLSAMLKRVQAQRRDGRRVLEVENAEDAAIFAQRRRISLSSIVSWPGIC